MKEIVQFLKEHCAGFFATVEGDQPRVRPFQFQFEEEGKLFFCTGSTKDVSKQLHRNPQCEFCAQSPEFQWVRIRGAATFCPCREIKERMLDRNEFLKTIYGSADNPIFEVFFIEHGEAIHQELGPKPPRRVSF